MSKYPNVPFSELFQRVERKVILEDGVTYKRIGVRWYGLGAFIRDSELGMNISRKQQWVVESGDVIYNKLFAWKGSFAVAGVDVHGHIASDKFPTYRHNAELIDIDYLRYYFQTPTIAKQAENLSKGAAAISKLTLNPPQFWDLTIPLPPLPEQQRIVARIEALAGKIEAARRLRGEAIKETEAIETAIKGQIFDTSHQNGWPVCILGEIADIRSGVTLGRRDLDGPLVRVPYLRVANVQDGYLDLSSMKQIEIRVSEYERWQLEPGDILLTEGGDWDKLGRGTVWQGEIADCIHQNHIFRLRLTPGEFNPYYVMAFISSPMGKSYFQEASKQTTNLATINRRQLAAFTLNKPPLEEQNRIVQLLDNFHEKATVLRNTQETIQRELDALLPALLDRAFKGEL